MAARFFLGLVESIIGPVFVIVTSNWWTRREQAFRTAFWLGGTPVSSEAVTILAFKFRMYSHHADRKLHWWYLNLCTRIQWVFLPSSISVLSNAVLVNGTIATWKIFFLFFGSLSFVFSLILMYFMPDNQANARWLTERERKVAIERVRENQTVTSDDHWKWKQFWEALRDPQTIFFFTTAV
jgi:ACS family allantoate permease-like MFS transporter